MKKFMVIMFCFVSILIANDLQDADKNETDFKQLKGSKSIFLSQESNNQKIYVGEIFGVKLKVAIANNEFEEIKNSFSNEQNITIMNPDSKWHWLSNNMFYNTFYMKANSTNAKLPLMSLEIYQNQRKIDSEVLQLLNPNIVQLNKSRYFNGVIAKSLVVKKHKTTQFNDNSLITVLEIEAFEANLDDFSLAWVLRDGVDSSTINLPYSKIFYYAIIPKYTREFTFTYFNRITNKFTKITIPIVTTDDAVSTQIDLNPANSNLRIYKDVFYGIIAILAILFYIKRRKAIYIVFIILLIIFVIYEKDLLSSVRVEKGTKVKILPTEKSTIFYITDKTLNAQKLNTKGKYIKVLLPNGKIGWIKNAEN